MPILDPVSLTALAQLLLAVAALVTALRERNPPEE